MRKILYLHLNNAPDERAMIFRPKKIKNKKIDILPHEI